MTEQQNDQLRESVRSRYGGIASAGESCCCGGDSCCGATPDLKEHAERLGYSTDEIDVLPEGADMGLGCGNPHAIANLKEGEVVLDLGSGGGLDCFLASPRVGPTGRAIGVDMTAEMVQKARANARSGGYTNVEFRLGEIEHLPVADSSIDVILSNCVINLSPDKESVFRETFRVLRPGGRLAISDVVAVKPLPAGVTQDPDTYCGCVGGAAFVHDVESMLTAAGFKDVRIDVKPESSDLIASWFPGSGFEAYARSALISAVKP